jgi:hypothetical protein
MTNLYWILTTTARIFAALKLETRTRTAGGSPPVIR